MTRYRWIALVVLAVMVAALIPASAQAQGAFYREVAKDGRIYVFNIAKEFSNWEKSGETGKAITKVAYGPNGETMIFDSVEALHLYNFKHDRPGDATEMKEVAAVKPPDNFKIGVGATIFADFTYNSDPKITDSDKNSVKKSEFEVRRAYINVTGNISDIIAFRITPDVGSRLATTVASTSVVNGGAAGETVTTTTTGSTNYDGSLAVRLKYAYGAVLLDKALTHGSWIRLGMQQTPYVDYIEGIYRYRFQGTIFVDRETFLSSSDLGLSGRYVFPNEYGDVHLGYYNGDTYSRAEANDQKAFMGRISIRPLPKVANLKGFRVALFYDADKPVKGGKRTRFTVAPTFEHKYVNAGFEYLNAEDKSSATKASVKANGWSVWITPRTTIGLEGLIRFDNLKPNKDVDANKKRTLIGAAYWFTTQKSPLATAILADYEQVKYDAKLSKPTEKRFEIKTLFNF